MIDSTSATTSSSTNIVTSNSVVSSSTAAITSAIKDSKVIEAGTKALGNLYDMAGKEVSGLIGQTLSSISAVPALDLLGGLLKKTIVQLDGTPPFPNILAAYASYNYIFTLSAIDEYSLNYPNETYKQGDIGQIILRSGSTASSNRVVIKDFGVFEFYIDDVEIDSTIGFQNTTGNTNMHSLKFKVLEPYSMGMFFHALTAAANHVGYTNYSSAVYLLTLEFKGHISPASLCVNGDDLSSIEKTTRHFPIKLNSIDMRVTTSGSEYEISARPYNEQAMSTTYSMLKTDVAISGTTVHEILQTGPNSLQAVMNKRLREAADKEKVAADEIIIYLPTELSSGMAALKGVLDYTKISATIEAIGKFVSPTTIIDKLKLSKNNSSNGELIQSLEDVNEIGKASMAFDPYRDGSGPFIKEDAAFDENNGIFKRGNTTINPKIGELKFSQDTSIINVINQVIVMSDFGRQALTQMTDNGKLVWWRVEPLVYVRDSEENMHKTGMHPRLIVYRVVPYKVDAACFLPPTKKNPKLAEARKQALKEYNYIYTGLNTEVLEFEMHFDNAYYKGLFANSTDSSGDVAIADKMATVAADDTNKKDPTQQSLASKIFGDINKLEQKVYDVITEERRDKTKSSNSNHGGAGLNDHDTLMAKQAHDIILSNGIDNVKPRMKILGDPYYIADSGWGNYTAGATNFENINVDHTMDYQSGQVDILVNFRTPLDANLTTGTFQFGDSKIISQFSGLYQVFTVNSTFSRGKFTQELSLIRRPGQA